MADLDPVQLGQVRLDVAHRHPAAVHRNDLVVEARRSAAGASARSAARTTRCGRVAARSAPTRARYGPSSASSRCGRCRSRLAAPAHARSQGGRSARRHRPLDQPLRQPLQQPVGAGDLLRRARAGEQLVDQLVRSSGGSSGSWSAGVDRRQSCLLRTHQAKQAFLSSRPAARESRASGHNSSQALPTQRIGQTLPVAAAKITMAPAAGRVVPRPRRVPPRTRTGASRCVAAAGSRRPAWPG